MPLSEAARAYLRRVRYDGDLTPSYDNLVALHRAHLDAVPYENLGIMLGRSPSVDPAASLARVGQVGRAGYCFHQNAALGVGPERFGERRPADAFIHEVVGCERHDQ